MSVRLPAEERETPPAHVHEWQANGTVQEQRVMYSPVSEMDHTYQMVTYAVQSCSCGKVRKVAVSAGPERWLNRRNR